MGPIVGWHEFIGMLRRRGPVMAAILVICILAALMMAMALPRAYQSIAVIQVQPTLLVEGGDHGGQDLAEASGAHVYGAPVEGDVGAGAGSGDSALRSTPRVVSRSSCSSNHTLW